MLNVDKVYTSKWMLKDSVRNYVISIIDSLPAAVALSGAQKSAIVSALDQAVTSEYEPTTPFADFQEGNGVVIPDTPTCLEIATDFYKNALGEDIDTTAETHVGRMIEQTATILRSGVGFTAANVMQMDLNCSTGRYLDAIGALFFSARRAAAATRVIYRIENYTANQVNLQEGSCMFKDGDGNEFHLGADAVLPAASTEVTPIVPGEVLCSFICSETGAVSVNPNGISWTLPSAATPAEEYTDITYGYDEESDADYRARLKVTRVSAVGFLESVKSGLMSIDGVYDCLVLENTANETEVISGIPMQGHSIVAFVDYDGTTATQYAVAEAIFGKKAIGCGYTVIPGGESESGETSSAYGTLVTTVVTDPTFGTKYNVYFYRPKYVRVFVKVYVSSNEYTGSDLVGDIKRAIASWANGDVPYVEGVKIGASIKAYEIGAAISDKIREIQIDEVTVAREVGGSAGTYGVKATLAAYEIGTITGDDIEVHVDEVD